MKPVEDRIHDFSAITNKNVAVDTIEEFFRIFHLVEAQEELLTLQQIIVLYGSNHPKERREELIYFCEKLKELITAAQQLRKSN